ncbi:MAG: SufD family Fe-S cluster assembly protein [Acutalibacteraceae bacterium]|nr:SufD family Fe-S cluster assembly protein [Acutalibacteraceae bacterium]
MNKIEQDLLKIIADMDSTPSGAFNIRANGALAQRNTTPNIDIRTKTDKDGIDIIIRPGTKGETVHIPVIISNSGISDLVYNDFIIGEDCDVTIMAGCGIHNCGDGESRHDGIHTFFVGKNAKVKYIERHYGEGDGVGGRNMNPTTVVNIAEGGYMEMETSQIKGIDNTKRITRATLDRDATLVIHEKIMTHGSQRAETDFSVDMNGENSSANVVSRSVARDNSVQVYRSNINGNNLCSGHTECDAIIMGNAKVSAIPEINANHIDASLIHEAAIGKIAGEQLIKLMTLGLTEQQAEEEIVNGFLK